MNELVQPWQDTYKGYEKCFAFTDSLEVPELDLDVQILSVDAVPLPSSSYAKTVSGMSMKTSNTTFVSDHEPWNMHNSSGLEVVPILDVHLSDREGLEKTWCENFDKKIISNIHYSECMASPEMAGPLQASNSIMKIAPEDGESLTKRCMMALLNGKQSALFLWHEDIYRFKLRTLSHESIYPEMPKDVLSSFLGVLMEFGTSFRRLQISIEYLQHERMRGVGLFTRLHVFLREYLDLIHDDISLRLQELPSTALVSILNAIQEQQSSLNWLCTILGLEDRDDIMAAFSELRPIHLLNRVHYDVFRQITANSALAMMSRELYTQLSRSLICEIAEKTGLGSQDSESSTTHSLLAQIRSQYRSLSAVDKPRDTNLLISPDQLNTIDAIDCDVKFLREYPHASTDKALKQMKSLGLQLTLLDTRLNDIQTQLKTWETELESLVTDSVDGPHESVLTQGTATDIQAFDEEQLVKVTDINKKAAISDDLHKSLALIVAPSSPDCATEDLRHRLQRHATESPGLSYRKVMRTCLERPLHVQQTLTRRQVLHVLLHQMRLKEHLQLIRQVYLLENRAFSDRLRTAIFIDTKSIIGLHGQGSHSKAVRWPPSAAKVSIATRSLFAETIDRKYLITDAATSAAEDYLGGLGILANLDEEHPEIPRHSLDALSFLKFMYRAPEPLAQIITAKSIQGYSQINQFLLILLRMSAIVDVFTMRSRHFNTLADSGTTNRFRMEASNFIKSFTLHIYETVIAKQCRIFDSVLNKDGLAVGEIQIAHQHMLDTISHSCLISPKLSQIGDILRLLLQSIIEFSTLIDLPSPDEDGIKKHYQVFDENVRKLIAVLSGAEDGKNDSFADGITARFLMNSYWSTGT